MFRSGRKMVGRTALSSHRARIKMKIKEWSGAFNCEMLTIYSERKKMPSLHRI